MNFRNKNIVITGGSKGIGAAISELLCALGANLIIIARNESILKAFTKELSEKYPENNIQYHVCDIADAKQVKSTIVKIKRQFNCIYGLICNAGTSYPEYFEKMPLDKFEKLMQVDYLGGVYFCHGLVSVIETKGFISLTSSVAGYMGVFGYSSYAPAKFALIGLAEVLRQELYHRQISVSVLCPPDTDTPGFEIEEKTKPFETVALSESAKLMSPTDVAKRYIKKLKKRKFIINVNFESMLFYRLHGIFPETVFKIIMMLIKKAKKNADNTNDQNRIKNV